MENTTFTFTPTSGNVISYSIDNGYTWTEGNSVELTIGKKVLWRGEMTPIDDMNSNGVGKFTSTGQFNVQGNIMSLLFGDNFQRQTDLTGKNYAFYRLFDSNSKLVNAQKLILPATTLAKDCYADMFYGCTGLVNAPELPATTLAYQCCRYMFGGCKNLTTAPTLPATTLAISCYEFMFYGCTNLNYIKCLATDISAVYSNDHWVGNVASSGTFVKAASMTSWTTGESGIPNGWNVQDAS